MYNFRTPNELDNTGTLSTLSGLSTPKIHPLPITENINEILEKRSNFSVIKGYQVVSNINSSYASSNPLSLRSEYKSVPSNTSASYNQTSKPLKLFHSPRKHPEHETNILGSKPVASNADHKVFSWDMEEFANATAGPMRSKSNHRNTPIASPIKKTMETHSRTKASMPKSAAMSSDFSWKGDKISEDFGRLSEADSQQSEGYSFLKTRTNYRIFSSNNSMHFDRSPFGYDTIDWARDRAKRIKAGLVNETILDKVLPFLGCADLMRFSQVCYEFRREKKYKGKFKKYMLLSLVKVRMSAQQQLELWNTFIDFHELKRAHPTAFTQNFVRECSYIKDINKDIDRTLPEHGKYSTEEGRSSLLRVLVAVSNSIRDLGYIQGLNSIAGVFLIYMKEERSFWATLYLLEKLKVKDILKENFQMINILNYEFEMLLRSYLPHIADHLKFQSITLSYITTPWFITLFSYFLPLSLTVKMWNFVFVKGYLFLLQFSLAVFSHFQNSILNMEPDDVPGFLKSELHELQEDHVSLFVKALEFKVTRSMTKDIEHHYSRGKPQLILNRTFTKKPKWEVIGPYESSHVLDFNDNKKTRVGRLDTQNTARPSGVETKRRASHDPFPRTAETKPEILTTTGFRTNESTRTQISFETHKPKIYKLATSEQVKAQIIEKTSRDKNFLSLIERPSRDSESSNSQSPEQSSFYKADMYVDYKVRNSSSLLYKPPQEVKSPPKVEAYELGTKPFTNAKKNKIFPRSNSLMVPGSGTTNTNDKGSNILDPFIDYLNKLHSDKKSDPRHFSIYKFGTYESFTEDSEAKVGPTQTMVPSSYYGYR